MIWILVFVVFAYILYALTFGRTKYWEERGVPHFSTWHQLKLYFQFMFLSKPIVDIVKESYNNLPDARYYGSYFMKMRSVTLRDLDLIKKITVKDFDSFTDHMVLITPDIEPLFGNNLFALKGQKWRDMRSTLSPVFTSSKMKAMSMLMSECARDLADFLYEKNQGKMEEMEMKDLFSRYTNDVIATTAFGIKCDSVKEPDNSFFAMGKQITNFGSWIFFKMLLFQAMPKTMKFLGFHVFDKKVSDFFTDIILETVQKREKEQIFRPDLINLLMEAKKGNLKHEVGKDADAGFATVEESEIGKSEKHQRMNMTDESMTAQALIFFFAGFDSSSTVMSYMAYELAVNPDVQKKLHEEIDRTLGKCGGDVTYDAILGMKYLDQVVSETLRKWTPGFQTDRVCIKDYVIEPVKPDERPFIIEKGTQVVIPICGIHYDPKYFPNPEKFDPDRFNDENKGSIVSGSYLPFGVGPRNCIGSRFALLEVKILFFHLLAKFELVVGKKTTVPIRPSPKKMNMMPENGCWLGLNGRKVTTL